MTLSARSWAVAAAADDDDVHTNRPLGSLRPIPQPSTSLGCGCCRDVVEGVLLKMKELTPNTLLLLPLRILLLVVLLLLSLLLILLLKLSLSSGATTLVPVR